MLRNTKIGTIIAAGYTVVLLMMMALTTIGIGQVNKISTNLTVMNDMASVKQRYAINFRGSVHDRAISLRDVVLMVQPGEHARTVAEIDRLAAFYATSATALDAMFAAGDGITAEERTILASIKQTEARTMPLIQRVIDLQQAGDSAAALTLLVQQARPAFIEWLARINAFIDFEEAANQATALDSRNRASNFQTLMLAVCGIALLIGAGFALLGLRAVRPLRSLSASMLRIAAGEPGVVLPVPEGRDEIADVTRAAGVFRDRMADVSRLAAEQTRDRQATIDQAERLTGLTRGFEAKAQRSIGLLSEATKRLHGTATTLTGTADRTLSQTGAVSAASDQTSSNVQTVAAAAEELSASIAEISRQVTQSSRVAGQAVEEARRSDKVVQELAEGAEKIGAVVRLISDIAGQTNLLALNATIEAARAGEAGKGFAVVASEVKNLAAQTAKATEEISGQITHIQGATRDAVSAIGGITSRIAEVSEIATAIAAAVEQQGSATAEIARNVQEAAGGTEGVSRIIGEVSGAAGETSSAANEVLVASSELARQGDELRADITGFLGDVGRFLHDVKAA